MASYPNRDIPKVVSELIIEMPEVRSELNALTKRIGRLDQRVERLEHMMETNLRLPGEATRQNTNRFIDAFSRNTTPLIERVPTHEKCFKFPEGSKV